MAAINTHGMKMHGLKAACSETKTLCGRWSSGGDHVQIDYDPQTHNVLIEYFVGYGGYVVHDDPAIIHVCTTSFPLTMQEIADRIYFAVKHPDDIPPWAYA